VWFCSVLFTYAHLLSVFMATRWSECRALIVATINVQINLMKSHAAQVFHQHKPEQCLIDKTVFYHAGKYSKLLTVFFLLSGAGDNGNSRSGSIRCTRSGF